MGRTTMQAAALLVAAGMVATGCSHTSNTPAGQSSTSAAAVQPWDPCTLSDSLITQAGFDPATKVVNPVKFHDALTCEFQSADLGLEVASSTKGSFAAVRAMSDAHDFQDLTIGGRPALIFHTGVEPLAEACDVVFQIAGRGTADLGFGRRPTTLNRMPVCDLAKPAVAALVAGIPQ